MKIRIGFWNVLRKLSNLEVPITELIKENALDVVCFAETGTTSDQVHTIANFISKHTNTNWEMPHPSPPLTRRTEIISHLPKSYIATKTVDQYYTSFTLQGPNIDLLVFVVHFPSLLHKDRTDLNMTIRRQADKIRKEFLSSKVSGYFVLGDFNLNPYDEALIGADGFNATNDRQIVLRQQRTIDGISYPYTYNPCWALLGQENGNVPGSYYLNSPGGTFQHWHTLDQVIFCPNAVKSYVEKSICRIIKIGSTDLLRMDKTGVTRINESTSDHLPLIFEIDI